MVINRQRRVPVASPSIEKFLARVMRLLDIPRDATTICLVTDAQMARWNRLYCGKAKATDVLSFPTETDAASKRAMLPEKVTAHRVMPVRDRRRRASRKGSYLGDIAIAPAVARRNARELGRTFDDEMRILVLHGVLHLLGYDHETDAGQMKKIELRLRQRLGIQ
ncbi:MAG: rRNA maturation RNase YbeY [Candidatus Acidiferrales bacterium]